MRCPNCGAEMQNGFAFCTRCGTPLATAGESRKPASGQNALGGVPVPTEAEQTGWNEAPARPSAYHANPAPAYAQPAAPKKQRPRWPLYVVIALLTALLVGMGYLLVTGLLDRDDEDDEDDDRREKISARADKDTDKADASSAEATAEPTAEPTPEPTPTPTPVPTSSPVAEGDCKIAVGNYLSAFVSDLNSEQYNRMYDYVQSGSAMETTQKDFILKSAALDQRETLLEWQVTNVSMQTENCYYLTAVETYEVFQNEEPFHWWVKQRCTYQVNRQADGTWKVANFVGKIEKLDSGNY